MYKEMRRVKILVLVFLRGLLVDLLLLWINWLVKFFIKYGTNLGYFCGNQRASFTKEQTTVVKEMGFSKEVSK